MANFGPPRSQRKLYTIRKVSIRAIQKCTFVLIRATVSKVMDILPPIWSCQVTQDANCENFLFCPNSAYNTRKSHKMSSGRALYF